MSNSESTDVRAARVHAVAESALVAADVAAAVEALMRVVDVAVTQAQQTLDHDKSGIAINATAGTAVGMAASFAMRAYAEQLADALAVEMPLSMRMRAYAVVAERVNSGLAHDALRALPPVARTPED